MANENILPLFGDELSETPQNAPPGKVEAAAAVFKALWALWQQDRPQRLLWIPVLWASGAGIYFALPIETPIVAANAAMILLMTVGLMKVQARAVVFTILVLLMGFAAAQWKTHSLEQPLVAGEERARSYVATLTRIEKRVEGGWRLHLEAPKVPGEDLLLPNRVRLLVRTDIPADISVGQRISLRAVLTPLPRPVSPGGYDFGRNLYLDGYGATGFAVSPVRVLGTTPDAGKPSMLQRYRVAIDAAISEALDGDTAGLAKALLLGDKAELSFDVRDAYRRAGLAHLLAISGLHMALVAGFVFLLIRQGLALSPRLALLLPLKSIAAGATIAALFGYLALVGAPISAQRAVVMATCVMLAIIVGRSAISLRTAAIAGMALLIFWPENVVNIGFQMSFTAVIALIAGYEAMAGTMASLKQRFGPKLGVVITYFAGIVLSTVVAEIAVFPLTLYHFNEITVYGLLGNAIAVPATGFWIMPMGIIGVLLTPFGLAEPAFYLMGLGLDVVTAITRDISAAPGAFVAARSPSTLSLIVFIGGGLWLCLWRTKIRLLGVAALIFAPFFAFQSPDPTILINARGSSIAVKTIDDGHVLLRGRRSNFAADVWSRQVGQTGFADLSGAYQRCDTLGCTAYLAVGKAGEVSAIPLNVLVRITGHYRLEIVNHPAGLRDACHAKSIILILFKSEKTCHSALAIFSRDDLQENGPLALNLAESPVSQAHVTGYDRDAANSLDRDADPKLLADPGVPTDLDQNMGVKSSGMPGTHNIKLAPELIISAQYAHIPSRPWHPQ